MSKLWQRLFANFETQEIMQAYYDERKPYMIRILLLIVVGRVGNIENLTGHLTYKWDTRADDTMLVTHYPMTDEGNAQFT